MFYLKQNNLTFWNLHENYTAWKVSKYVFCRIQENTDLKKFRILILSRSDNISILSKANKNDYHHRIHSIQIRPGTRL